MEWRSGKRERRSEGEEGKREERRIG